jgi:tetratricopeptide (TPR) repeat protein
LQISEICPEAYIVLALREANSFEEALEHFKKAMEQGVQIKTPEDLQKTLKSTKVLWEKTEMRAYLRGIFGVGNTLRKMGRYAEALPYYEQLSELNAEFPSSSPTFLDYNAHLPQLWFEVFGPEECLKRMESHLPIKTMHNLALRLNWFATMALALFSTQKYTEYKGMVSQCASSDPRPFSERLQGYLDGNCWPDFLVTFAGAVDLLLEKIPMPKGRVPRAFPTTESYSEAATYVHECRQMWKKTPGALEFLLKMRNTFALFHELYGKHVDGARRPHKTLNVEEAKKLMDEGFFVNAVTDFCGYSTLLELLVYKSSTRNDSEDVSEVTLELLKHGANPSLCGPGTALPNTPFQIACYYAAGPEIVRAMVENSGGNDAYLPAKSSSAPIIMAIQRGNWRELDEILKAVPFGKHRTFPAEYEEPAFSNYSIGMAVPGAAYAWERLYCSTVVKCVVGLGTCGCKSQNSPHDVHCDFRKVIAVLLKHGVKPPKNLLIRMEMGMKEFPEDGPLLKYIKWRMKKGEGARATAEWCSYFMCCKTSEDCKLKACSGCNSVKYCSASCQKKHWSAQHKLGCKQLRKEAKNRGGNEL